MPIPSGLMMPIEKVPWTSLALGAAMLAGFALSTRFQELSPELLRRFGLSLETISPDSLIGHAFLHGNILDLLVSLFLLAIIGTAVENKAGWHRFLAIFAVGVTVNGALHVGLSPWLSPSYPFLGCSGGTLALIGAGVAAFPHAKTVYRIRTRKMWGYSYHEIELPFFVAGALCLMVDLIMGVSQSGTLTPLVMVRIGSFVAGAAMAFLLGVPRDSKEASEAAAVFVQTGDYRTLSKLELSALAESQPDNPHITLALLDRLTKDRLRPNPELKAQFAQQIPLFEENTEMALSAGTLLLGFREELGLSMEQALRVAHGVNQQGEVNLSKLLYDWILHSNLSDEDEKETAAFRLANLLESTGQTDKAVELYNWLVQTYPFGSLSAASQSRLKEIEDRGK